MELEPESFAHMAQFENLLEKARDLETKSPEQARAAYLDIVLNAEGLNDPSGRGREQALHALCAFLVQKGLGERIVGLHQELRPFFDDLPKAKTAKLVRTLIDYLAKIPGTVDMQIGLCKECVEWCRGEKRTFLRQRVETRLSALLLEQHKYNDALELLTRLLVEVKKLDDKLLLVEIHLITCRTHYAVQNIPKAKAELTASKTNANAIHCPPLLQADIDFWSGVISAREKDFRTSFSYFYEAYEAYHAAEQSEKALQAMKLQMLSKIMNGQPADTKQIVNSKTGLTYTGRQVEAMVAIAEAYKERSLQKFEDTLKQFQDVLGDDPVTSFHLTDLNETMLEQNVSRILEPFDRVEIAHVAELLELSVQRTQQKLREMILDQKLRGTLDQGIGVLIVFEEEAVRSTYDCTMKTIKNTSEVLDTLYGVAKQLA